jgi:predicted DNA-binding protein with PD1-like motif
MKSKLVWEKAGERTFVLILDPGEEAFAAITEFADREKLRGASLTALGAFARAEVGWFDTDTKKYRNIPVDQQCELLSAISDIAEGDDGNASLHLHVVLGLSDGSTMGGHLLRATVRPTMEVTVVETPVHLRRKKRPDLVARVTHIDG